MQIRSISSAPVLHPTIAPFPISAISNGDLGAKQITIIDLQSELSEVNLVNGDLGAKQITIIDLQSELDRTCYKFSKWWQPFDLVNRPLYFKRKKKLCCTALKPLYCQLCQSRF